MADIVKLKKKAADLEAKKQTDKALEVYVEIVDAYEAGDEDTIDIPLYNRVGDMLQKAGRVTDAVEVWEKAVDRYAEGGFYNPAIALCNKILRQSPGRTVIYYKLGKIHAEKGFKGDARQNFLEYASRQQKAGKLDEAFRALKEFADLVPGQHDVRLMLAEQLLKADRKDEAVDQLQLGYSQAKADGDDEAVTRIVAKLKDVDPSIEPEEKDTGSSGGGGGLIFLDVDDADPPRRASTKLSSVDVKRVSKAVAGLELLEPGPLADAKPAAKASPTAKPSPAAPPSAPPRPETPAAPAARAVTPPPMAAAPAEPVIDEPPAPPEELVIETTQIVSDVPPPRGSLLGLEVTNLAESATVEPVESLLDVEPEVAPELVPELQTELEPEPEASAPTADLPLMEIEAPAPEAVAEAPLVEVEPEFETSIVEPPSLEVDTSALELTSDSTTLGSFDNFEVIHSGAVDAPVFDIPEPEPEVELEPEVEPEPLAAAVDVDDEVQEIVEPETVPSPETIAKRASAAIEVPTDLPMLETDVELELIEVPLPSSAPAAVDVLREAVAANPEDWTAHRHLAEALLEEGARDEAMVEFEVAMAGFESAGDLDTAGSVADEIVRIDPKSTRSHQKRVEYAFRSNNRAKLATAYLELADALLADGQAQKARAVYQRVLDITPDDLRAQAAIESIPIEEPAPAPPPRRSTVAAPKPSAPAAPSAPAKTAAARAEAEDDDYVSLGDWLREDDEPKSTRMVVAEQEPTGDEEADFSDMLRKFKQGVAENVDDEDHEAHYDLGVAYKEMGLVDEAIAEFQKALRGTKERVRTFESLGNCFIEKGQLPVAATILQRALAEPGVRDESLIGVLYLLGGIAEEQQQFADAKRYYERVFAVDIQFRDIGDRLNTVEQQLS